MISYWEKKLIFSKNYSFGERPLKRTLLYFPSCNKPCTPRCTRQRWQEVCRTWVTSLEGACPLCTGFLTKCRYRTRYIAFIWGWVLSHLFIRYILLLMLIIINMYINLIKIIKQQHHTKVNSYKLKATTLLFLVNIRHVEMLFIQNIFHVLICVFHL